MQIPRFMRTFFSERSKSLLMVHNAIHKVRHQTDVFNINSRVRAYFLYFESKVVRPKVFARCMMNSPYTCAILLIGLPSLPRSEHHLERLNRALKKRIGAFYLLVFNISYVFFKYMVFTLNTVYLL